MHEFSYFLNIKNTQRLFLELHKQVLKVTPFLCHKWDSVAIEFYFITHICLSPWIDHLYQLCMLIPTKLYLNFQALKSENTHRALCTCAPFIQTIQEAGSTFEYTWCIVMMHSAHVNIFLWNQGSGWSDSGDVWSTNNSTTYPSTHPFLTLSLMHECGTMWKGVCC